MATEVLEVVERALHKRMEGRYQTAQHMSFDIERCLRLLPQFWTGAQLVDFVCGWASCHILGHVRVGFGPGKRWLHPN